MSPRHFWNHPLQELARSLSQTFKPGEQVALTPDEFSQFLGRLVGSTAQGPRLVSHPAAGAMSPDAPKTNG